MRICIILFLLNLVCTDGKSQSAGLTIEYLKQPAFHKRFVEPYVNTTKGKMSTIQQQSLDLRQKTSEKPQKLPSAFSVEALPFFCKIEYKMGLNKKLPLKFRLGDVQYVEELEGKCKTVR